MCNDHGNNVKSIKCPSCREEHQVPQEGFRTSRLAKKLLDDEAYLNKEQKSIKRSMTETAFNLEKILADFASIHSNHECHSFDKFADIQREMDIHREELKMSVAKRIDEIFFQMSQKLAAKRDAIAKSQQECYRKIAANDLIQMTQTQMAHFRHPNLTMDSVHKLRADQETRIGSIKSLINTFHSQIDEVNSFGFTKAASIVLKESNFGFLNLENQSPPQAISCSFDKTIKIWDLESGECVKTLVGHDGLIYCLEKLDDNRIISCSDDGLIKVWDLQQGTCLLTLLAHKQTVSSLRVLDKNFFATGSIDIKIWSVQREACVKILLGHKSFVRCLILLPDGRGLVSGSQDKSIKVWDLGHGACTQTLNGHTDSVYSLLLLLNGLLASGSADKSIKIWNLATEQCVTTLAGHSSFVWGLEQINGNELISCSSDNTIKTWNLDTRVCVATIVGHAAGIASIKKYQDDKLISCGDDRTIKLWNNVNKQCVKTIHTDHKDVIQYLILV
jgi:hypothetical protein